MKKCYFFVIVALVAFSNLAFSMENTNDSFADEEIAAAAVNNEDSFSSYNSYVVSGAQNVVNGCVEIIDSVVGTPTDVFNGCCFVAKQVWSSGMMIPVVLALLVDPAETANAANCSACEICTCACFLNNGAAESIGKAANMLMCSQVCNSNSQFKGMFSCR